MAVHKLNMTCGLWLMAVAGLLQPLVKELTNVQDPLTCLSALSLLKEQVEQASSSRLQSLLANFFLPHLEQLLRQADSIVKPMAMQAGSFVRLTHFAPVHLSCMVATRLSALCFLVKETVVHRGVHTASTLR